MNKKKYIALLTLSLFVCISLIFVFRTEKKELKSNSEKIELSNPSTSIPNTLSNESTKKNQTQDSKENNNTDIWNYNKLLDFLQNNYEDLGECQIITTLFGNKNQVIFENNDGIQVISSLVLEDNSKLIFKLVDTNPSISGVKLGDTFKLIRKNDIIYIYK